jgi:formylglycine-generating enzyme required for sulfatase activity
MFRKTCLPAAAAVVSIGLILAAPPPDDSAVDPAAADFRPYTEKLDDRSFDMVPIRGGSFTMGSPAAEKGRTADEGSQVKVHVGAFWMAKLETTWELYALYWKDDRIPNGDKRLQQPPGKKDAVTRPSSPYIDETFGHGYIGKPALGMTHHAALMYCRWLSQKTGKNYRLPTEAEWEYACRAGSTAAYPFGDDPEKLAEYAWYGKNAEEDTHEVGSKKPNAWGLHDMLGNVGEWCIDHYSPTDYQKYRGPILDPLRKPTRFKYSHVVRGGSWADPADRCRSATRRGSDKSWQRRDPEQPQSIWWLSDADFVGFRVVRPVTELAELKDFLPPVDWRSENNEGK